MPSIPEVTVGVKGQLVCRPTGWVDVIKFFLLNYGLHALTVHPQPEGTLLTAVLATVSAMIAPFTGMMGAIKAIYRLARSEPDALKVAQYSGSLCLVLLPGKLRIISCSVTNYRCIVCSNR